MARNQFDIIFDRFEDFAHAERVTGIPEKTWRNWKVSGYIPQKHHLNILIGARTAGLDLRVESFSEWLHDALLERAGAATRQEKKRQSAAA